MELEILKSLKNLNCKDIYDYLDLYYSETENFFGRYKEDFSVRAKMVEFLVNFLIGKHEIHNKKGKDFKDFELKCITLTDRNKLAGDTPISTFDNKPFEKSNVIDKLKNLILVFFNRNLDIVDIRYFDYTYYIQELKNDWKDLENAKFLRKKKNNNKFVIMWKMNKGISLLDLSFSVAHNNSIYDAIGYLNSFRKERAISYSDMLKMIENKEFNRLYEFIK